MKKIESAKSQEMLPLPRMTMKLLLLLFLLMLLLLLPAAAARRSAIAIQWGERPGEGRHVEPDRRLPPCCIICLILIYLKCHIVSNSSRPRDGLEEKSEPSSIGHPPDSSASPVELRLRVGPRALSKKKEVR